MQANSRLFVFSIGGIVIVPVRDCPGYTNNLRLIIYLIGCLHPSTIILCIYFLQFRNNKYDVF